MFSNIVMIIPTYNEAENLPRLVKALFTLPMENLRVLVVDDRSPDGTGDVAEDLAGNYPQRLSVIHRTGKRGFAVSYLEGIQAALANGADALGQMDADLSHPPEKLPELVETLANCDVVLGSRYVPGGGVDPCWAAWRKALSRFGNFYARAILSIPVQDVTGGYRLWRRRTLESMPLDRVGSNGYAFQVEMLYLAYRLGFCFREVPILFTDRCYGKSKMSFRIQREAALRVWQIKLAYRSIKPIAQ